MEVDDEDTNQSTSNLQPPTQPSGQKARRHTFFVRSGEF